MTPVGANAGRPIHQQFGLMTSPSRQQKKTGTLERREEGEKRKLQRAVSPGFHSLLSLYYYCPQGKIVHTTTKNGFTRKKPDF
jgi:hypothetical protein